MRGHELPASRRKIDRDRVNNIVGLPERHVKKDDISILRLFGNDRVVYEIRSVIVGGHSV